MWLYGSVTRCYDTQDIQAPFFFFLFFFCGNIIFFLFFVLFCFFNKLRFYTNLILKLQSKLLLFNLYVCLTVGDVIKSIAYSYLPLFICIICKYLRAVREISFVLIVLPSWNKVFIIIIIDKIHISVMFRQYTPYGSEVMVLKTIFSQGQIIQKRNKQ